MIPMKFKLFGTEIYISFLFAAVTALMLACDRTGLAMPMLFSVMLHEAGHLFAMWATDCAPKRIKLIPASVQITRSITSGLKNDIFIALCGPAVNFLLFLSFFFNYLAFKNENVLYYALLNLIIGLFNSLPVSGLDGGTVLFSLLTRKADYNRAALILKLISLAVALALTALAVILTVKGHTNPSMYIIALYLTVMSIIKM